jgi:hypothetical protein
MNTQGGDTGRSVQVHSITGAYGRFSKLFGNAPYFFPHYFMREYPHIAAPMRKDSALPIRKMAWVLFQRRRQVPLYS